MKFKYSYSRLSMFEKCPFMFMKYVVDKVQRKPSIPMAIGSMAHEIFYAYTSHCLKEHRETDIGVIENMALDIFNKEGTLESQYLQDVVDLARLFAESHII